MYSPVCSKSGRTFRNSCLLRCDGEILDYDGACKKKDCNCTYEYLPVCGVNGTTYSNSCLLNCAKVRLDYNGKCCNCNGVAK